MDMFRHHFYQSLLSKIPEMEKDGRAWAAGQGYEAMAGRYGTYQGSSSIPARLPDYVLDAIVASNAGEVVPARRFADAIRDRVKTVYGDDWDVAVANTAEAGLRITYETLFAPPILRRGEQYRARVLQLLGEDFEWGGSYGRAFPPRYKNLATDRTAAGGELGIEGKSIANLDTLFVRGAGVRYEIHGSKPSMVPLMGQLDVDGTLAAMAKAADRHAAFLAGVHAVGYDTPGWGLGEKDADGHPRLLKGMAAIARDHGVPFVVDCASCLPFVGMDPRAIGADIMIYSMDKAGRAPISGLIIGRAEVMSPIRKGLGWDGPRTGGVSSYSKGVFSAHDPGRDSLVGLEAFLRVLHEEPGRVTAAVDGMDAILREEVAGFPARFRNAIRITKSLHMGGVELNYADTWTNADIGLPLYGLEDLYANTNAMDAVVVAMGQAPSTIYSGNVLIGPGHGMTDTQGQLIPEVARAALRGLVKSFEIVARHGGLV